MKPASLLDSQRSSPRFANVLPPALDSAHRAACMRLSSRGGGRTKSEASPHLRLVSAWVQAEADSAGLFACDSDADMHASFAVDSFVGPADSAQQVSELKEQLASMHSEVQRLAQAELSSLTQCQGSSQEDQIMTSERRSEDTQRVRESPKKENVGLRLPGSDLTHLQAEMKKMAETIHEHGCLSDALCAEVQQKFEEMQGRIDEGLVQMQEKITSCTNAVSIEAQRMLREGLEAMDARLREQIQVQEKVQREVLADCAAMRADMERSAQEFGCRSSTFQLDVQGKIDKLFARDLSGESDARMQALQLEAARKSFDERLLEHKEDMQLQLKEFEKRLDSAVDNMRQRQQEHKQQEHEQQQEANDEADEQMAQCGRRLKRLPSGAAGVVKAFGKMQRSTSSVNSSASLRSSSRSSLSPMSPQHSQLRQLVALAMRGPEAEAEEKLEPPPDETQSANPEVGSALLSGALPHASDFAGPEQDGLPVSASLSQLPDSPSLPHHAQMRQLVDRALSEPEAAEA